MSAVLAFVLQGHQDTPGSAQAVLRQADALHGAGQSAAAVALLQEALATHPRARRAIHERLGAIRLGQGRTGEAALHLDHAVRLGSGDETKLRLAEVQLALDRDAEAAALIEDLKGRESDPRLQLLRRLSTAAQLGDSREARDIYRELTRTAPEEREPWRRLGRLETATGRYQEALATTGLALARFRDDPEFLRMDGEAAYLAGDHTRSLRSFGRLVDLERRQNPPIPPHLVDLARALLFLGERPRANALLDQFLAVQPEHCGALFFRALGALREGDYRTAYARAAYVCTAYPNWNESRLLAGAAALGLGDIASAQTYLTGFPAGRPERDMGRRLLEAARKRSPTAADAEPLRALLDQVLR